MEGSFSVDDRLNNIGQSIRRSFINSSNIDYPNKEEKRKKIIKLINKHFNKEGINNISNDYIELRINNLVNRLNVNIFTASWKTLNVKTDDLFLLSMYDIKLVIDDSGSIEFAKDDRKEYLKIISKTIAKTSIALDDDGIDIYFFGNEKRENIITYDIAEDIIDNMKFGHVTIPGTTIKKEILIPYFNNINNGITSIKPLIIYLITDGVPNEDFEARNKLKNVILEYKHELKNRGYPVKFITYQLVQVGNDSDATRYLDDLDNDTEISDVVDATSCYEIEKEQYARNNNGVTMESTTWFVKLLLGSIITKYNEMS